MEGSITKLALILYNSVEYIMQGRMPKLTFPSAVELRFSNYSNRVLINSSCNDSSKTLINSS